MSIVKAVIDRLSLVRDDSEEAAMGRCGFTTDEVAASPQVPVTDLDDDE